MMCPVIDNPANYEIHTVFCLLHAKNISAAEIYNLELCTVYGQNVMNEL
jgi:hypothetical protein